MENSKVLLIDDDSDFRMLTKYQLESSNLRVIEADSANSAMNLVDRSFDVVLLDINMPKVSGVDYLDDIKRKHPELPVIMFTSLNDANTALESLRKGAFWYLTKNSTIEEITSLIQKAVQQSKLISENYSLKQSFHNAEVSLKLVGKSKKIQSIKNQLEKIKNLNSTLLLTGESGTGKNLIARVLHDLGPRKNKPFIRINCAGFPRDMIESELFGYEDSAFSRAKSSRMGKFEIADGGTIFLDEIGDIPLEIQSKLLEFIQNREIQKIGSNKKTKLDVRIIAASNQNLKSKIETRQLRKDFLHRLHILNIELPALRDRKEDIDQLVSIFIKKISKSRGVKYIITEPALKFLNEYRWPGNVRELENVIERATAFCSDNVIKIDDIVFFDKEKAADQLDYFSTKSLSLKEIESRAIINALIESKGSKTNAAKTLGISERSIYNKIKRLGIEDAVKKLN